VPSRIPAFAGSTNGRFGAGSPFTGTAYSVNASVTHGSAFYRCLVAHTSGTLATDLAAGNWILIVDFSTIALVAASLIAVTPSGSLTTNVQTSLQALDSGKAPTAHSHVSTAISDSTTAGRALQTAPNAAAQNALLGTTSLGFQSGNIKETAGLILESGWYWCDGSNKSRVTDAPFFNAITIQQSGTLNANTVVTGLTDTTNGGNTPILCRVAAPTFRPNTVVLSVDGPTQVTLRQAATGSGVTPLVFAPYGVGAGSTAFGIPNRVYLGVGRDNASGSASNITQVSTAITTKLNSVTATVSSATGLLVGMFVGHPKVPFGTTITAISGTTITMSAAATASVSASGARFSPLGDVQTVGQVGGSISIATTLVTANLPPYSPAGTITNGAITSTPISGTEGSNSGPAGAGTGATIAMTNATPIVISSTQAASTFAGSAQGGTSTPIVKSTLSPTIVMNYIIKR
jgi:hypothetical protein